MYFDFVHWYVTITHANDLKKCKIFLDYSIKQLLTCRYIFMMRRSHTNEWCCTSEDLIPYVSVVATPPI